MGPALPSAQWLREGQGGRLSGIGLAVGGLVAASLSFGWGVAIRHYGLAWGLVDVPNERSSHVEARPRGAGVGIVLGTIVVASAVGVLSGMRLSASLWAVLALGAVLGTVGFVDDRWELLVRPRLTAQVIAAGLLVSVLYSTIGDVHVLEWLLAPIAALAIVSATNVFNFMDGIDGIAGGTAFATAITWAALGWDQDIDALVILGVVVAAACAGFLILNWSPARVFMGDSGSLFLGFITASVPLVLSVHDLAVGIVAGVPLLPFFVDGALTIVRRTRRRERLTEAHRSHLYQDLAWRHGHGPVAAAYVVTSLVAGLGGVFLASSDARAAGYAAVTLVAIVVLWLTASRSRSARK